MMEAHTPYRAPADFGGPEAGVKVTIKHSLGVENPPEDTEQAYQNAVSYLSSMYRDIYSHLEDDFDYIFTLADHGEMLGEHDVWNHTYGLFPEITHVPLVVSGNGLEGSSDAVVSLLDVQRTIAEFADIEVDSRGRNLIQHNGEPRLTEYHGLIPVALKRLEEAGVDNLEEYDSNAHGVAIPPSYHGFEHDNEIQSAGEADETPEAVLDRLIEDLQERETDDDEEDLSEETIDQLSDLGYM